MKVIANYLGGSNSYGLATPTSDRDERYLFLNTEISKIIGLERHEHQSKQTDEVDSFGWEFKHFLNMLKAGNTMCLEMMFNETWIEISPEFKYIQSFRNRLIDSHKLYKCLRGYCQSERRLVLGERTGVLGGKRREHLDKYGYSYKNLVQYLRLCMAGGVFFQTGVFPVDIRPHDKFDIIWIVKNHPENFSKERAIEMMSQAEKCLDDCYADIKVVHKYDENLANELCFDMYYPILDSHFVDKEFNKLEKNI
jgi:hypothetical protein